MAYKLKHDEAYQTLAVKLSILGIQRDFECISEAVTPFSFHYFWYLLLNYADDHFKG